MIPFIIHHDRLPNTQQHYLQADFAGMTLMQRLEFIFKGGFAPKTDLYTEAFEISYRDMLKWREVSKLLCVRFEDLVGTKGGGDDNLQIDTLKQIADHLYKPNVEDIHILAAKLYNEHSLFAKAISTRGRMNLIEISCKY